MEDSTRKPGILSLRRHHLSNLTFRLAKGRERSADFRVLNPARIHRLFSADLYRRDRSPCFLLYHFSSRDQRENRRDDQNTIPPRGPPYFLVSRAWLRSHAFWVILTHLWGRVVEMLEIIL